MRASVILLAILGAAAAWAGEREDRADIERLIAALNQSADAAQRRALLLTDQAQNELDQLLKLERRLAQQSDQPWSELTKPHLVVQSIRFITPEVALVDASSSQYGSVVPVRRVPLLMVMKKEKQWRVASIRILADIPGFR